MESKNKVVLCINYALEKTTKINFSKNLSKICNFSNQRVVKPRSDRIVLLRMKKKELRIEYLKVYFKKFFNSF